MNKPHKHCELIKAWADGAEIQVKVSGTWSTIASYPTWCEDLEYRIKPPTIRYRVGLLNSRESPMTVTADTDEQAKGIESLTSFIDWITDWIEVECEQHR